MKDGPLTDDLRALVTACDFDEPFHGEGLSDLLDVLTHVRLETGDVLMRQGEFGSDLFLVLNGRLEVRLEQDGVATRVGEIEPGSVAGEMALLTGQPRTATVAALERCDLARLAREDFERLAARHPDALNEFLHRILPRLRGTQLVRVLSELFGPLDDAALTELQSAMEWVELPSGETLFHEGDPGSDVYIVVNGRLRVVTTDLDGRERVLEEVGRGGAVGELALLTGEPRAATIYAVRDTDLAKLSATAFESLLDRHPRAMMRIARAAAWRLRHNGASGERRSGSAIAFALMPISDGLDVGAFSHALAEALGEREGVLVLDSAEVDRRLAKPGIAQSSEDAPVHESIVAWLSAHERDHRHLVLVCDAGWTPWTRRCLRQADRVLLLARADASPDPGPLEQPLRSLRLRARQELLLLHPPTTAQPRGTLRWLERREVAAHHHVRLGHKGDLGRLARLVSGRARGLVLGGGGARGFAHIGMLRALQEEGVEIDVVGGTSIGSVIAGAHAAGLSVDRMTEIARAFASPAKLLDRTLPITALMAGRKVTNLYRQVFGDLAIEDLWMPFFAVSSGLSRAQAVVHRTGPLWFAARASTAIPAIFPPILNDRGDVLVDGNVMNNMPLDVMREICEGGTVIGMNPMPTDDKVKDYRFGASLSGWEALKGRFHLFGSKVRAPSIFGAVMRATEINSANRMRQPSFRALADLIIEPPLGEYPILAFAKYEPIIDVGYRVAKQKISAWKLAGGGHD